MRLQPAHSSESSILTETPGNWEEMEPISQGIVLDTTLDELYAQDESSNGEIVLVYAVPTADIQMSTGVPLSKKFVYQSPLNHTHDGDELARLFLEIVPQLFGFIAGPMSLVLFDLDPNQHESSQKKLSSGDKRPHQNDAYQVFEQLHPTQRPRLSFVTNPRDILLPPKAEIAIASPMDCLLHLPHDIDPEAHYSVLSKRALALSSLPTPTSTVIDTKISPQETPDEKLVAAEIARILKPIAKQALPFAVKMPQALSGQGTFLIRTETLRRTVTETLAPEISRMLHQLNESNQHLQPCSLVLQSMIESETASLSFFVTRSGKMVFQSCTSQIMDTSGHWAGGYISYREQDSLREKFAGILEEMSRYVHSKGYYGPISADIMTDSEGRHVVVDLNARVGGSHPIGLLRNHFSRTRGLHEAVLFFPLYLKGTKQDFMKAFESRFRDESMVICGWCHDRMGVNSIACVVLAAETKEKLQVFVDEVKMHALPG
ncbi:MAG: hypothetical protein L6R41_007857 [Letrouitia leprolyta]|nr:MAG: hypothetical protein L6R41_007857 [Letrouitia leprolyta]